MTSRGLNENDFTRVADFIHLAIGKAIEINKKLLAENKTKLTDFKDSLNTNENKELQKIAGEVTQFCSKFPMPN